MKIRWRTETRTEAHEVTTFRVNNLEQPAFCRHCGEPAVLPTTEPSASQLTNMDPMASNTIEAIAKTEKDKTSRAVNNLLEEKSISAR